MSKLGIVKKCSENVFIEGRKEKTAKATLLLPLSSLPFQANNDHSGIHSQD
ncbi:MAG TPA: hypothetical protein VFC63_21240 [Blastocatellia bacterium]|nr:hypothetical protein [Blastocatellia bacterium]